MRTLLKSIVMTLFGGVAIGRLAFAYIDPNTGGLLFQLLAVMFTFFTGIMFFFSRNIREFVARTKRFLRDDSE